ncbi:DUF1178 family protein [Niveibacterium sp. SC-1]|uniref:DUF1178 family protein n=1 Tax=Niveibacterium sp. SC-1 TaxID=3135646 RepID=UPI00311F6DCE
MIILDLRCAQDHRFEAWFASAESYESQRARHLVSCPICADADLTRLPSAPAVHVGGEAPATKPIAKAEAQPTLVASDPGTRALLQKLRELAGEAEDVGERFADEARGMHRGEIEERHIRGKARPDEVRDLLEEGIGVLPVPPDPEKLN